jgi:hypothetical protein
MRKLLSRISKNWPSALAPRVSESIGPDDFGEIDKALAIENGPVIVNVHINGDVELLGNCAASRKYRRVSRDSQLKAAPHRQPRSLLTLKSRGRSLRNFRTKGPPAAALGVRYWSGHGSKGIRRLCREACRLRDCRIGGGCAITPRCLDKPALGDNNRGHKRAASDKPALGNNRGHKRPADNRADHNSSTAYSSSRARPARRR